MSPTHFKIKSLSGTIFRSALVFTIVIVIAFAVIISTLFYYTYERDAERSLIAQAQDAAEDLNATSSSENVPILSEQFAGQLRYTLIGADGTVLYDSASESSLENHADRPEVQGAEENGQATTSRYSKTLQTDTVYAAIKLDDGSIIRLAETRHSLLAFLGNLLWPLVLSLVVIAALVFFLSRILTKRIMKPIDALNFKDPLQNEIYEEMDPLLERIDEQQALLKEQNEELALAENMRRDFSSNVSHEMKTPLQVISGYAELMKNDMVKPEDRLKFAGLIYDEAQAMRSLIDDVLTLSRLDESAVSDGGKRIDLYTLSSRVAQRLESFAEANDIKIRVQGSSAYIKGSETLAEEMIYNLVENGIRYNKPGGEVIVRVENEGSDTVVRVSDTGPGVAEDVKDKIFERFFRVEKSRSKETGGTGLGLAIVKHAVSFHGGTIVVESKLGEGTTFIIRFPR